MTSQYDRNAPAADTFNECSNIQCPNTLSLFGRVIFISGILVEIGFGSVVIFVAGHRIPHAIDSNP